VVVGRVLAGAAAAVDEDDQRLRVVALRLEQPDLVVALPDAALDNAAFALGGTAAAGEQAGEEGSPSGV